MEIDKTQLAHDVASSMWAAGDPLGLNGTFDEQDKSVQFHVKSQILPVVVRTMGVAEKHVKKQVLDKIAQGQENGLTADEIIWSLTLELT